MFVGRRRAERQAQPQIVEQPERREVAEQELAGVEPVIGRRHLDAAVVGFVVDKGVIHDVREVEENVDLRRPQPELLRRCLDLAMIDDGAEGHDAEVPHRLALPGGLAGHQSHEALLIGHAERLGEQIADGEDRRLALVGLAGSTVARAEAVAVGAKSIERLAPGTLRVLVRRQVVVPRDRNVGLGIGRRCIPPVPFPLGEDRGQHDMIQRQGQGDDHERLDNRSQQAPWPGPCLRHHLGTGNILRSVGMRADERLAATTRCSPLQVSQLNLSCLLQHASRCARVR